MDLTNLISALASLEGPDREIDAEIAVAVGYRKSTSNPLKWLEPTGSAEVNLPAFTGSIDIAYQLARTLRPDLAGACSWEPGKGYAKLGDNTAYEASGPAIAICIAALSSIEF
jgi:hypothetical protein